MARSLLSGGGGTFASQAIFTNTLVFFGTGMGALAAGSVGSRIFGPDLVGDGVCFGIRAGPRVVDFTQNPGLGDKETGTVDMAARIGVLVRSGWRIFNNKKTNEVLTWSIRSSQVSKFRNVGYP